MQAQLLAMVTPAIAVIFSGVFALLWWRDHSQSYVGALLFSYLALTAGLLVSFFAISPGGANAALTVHAFFTFSVLSLIWGAAKRVGQSIPLAAMLSCSLIAAPFLWQASLIDDEYIRLYVQGSLNGLFFAIGAVILWRAAARNIVDRLVTGIFVLLSANFFIRPQIAMMVGGHMTIDEYRASIFYSLHVLSLAVFALLLALILSAATMIDQHHKQQKRSESDPLTGLRLRRAYDSAATEMLNRARLRGVPVSVIVADIDHFKRVNDMWGHAVGDEAIAGFGKMLGKMIRDTDIAGRVGGEEFCILVWNCEIEAAERLAERIRQAFAAQSHVTSRPDLRLTASFGVTGWREGESYARAFTRGDAALYSAKDKGRNRVETATGEGSQSGEVVPFSADRMASRARRAV